MRSRQPARGAESSNISRVSIRCPSDDSENLIRGRNRLSRLFCGLLATFPPGSITTRRARHFATLAKWSGDHASSSSAHSRPVCGVPPKRPSSSWAKRSLKGLDQRQDPSRSHPEGLQEKLPRSLSSRYLASPKSAILCCRRVKPGRVRTGPRRF